MKTKIFMVAALSLFVAQQAAAASCKQINWRNGDVVKVYSSLYQSTRLQLPEGSVMATKDAQVPNGLWHATGAANQILIQPNSAEEAGKSATITAFLNTGEVVDIEAVRVGRPNHQQCVVLSRAGMSSADRNAISGAYQGAAAYTAQGQRQIAEQQAQSKSDRDRAVTEALKKYRYYIYTRYNWETGSGFSGKNVISDVYDDGRFTYIRLAKPNRGLLAVVTEQGGEEAIAPTKYDDAYHIYQISGIYPSFTLQLDGKKIKVTRSDNATHGES